MLVKSRMQDGAVYNNILKINAVLSSLVYFSGEKSEEVLAVDWIHIAVAMKWFKKQVKWIEVHPSIF